MTDAGNVGASLSEGQGHSCDERDCHRSSITAMHAVHGRSRLAPARRRTSGPRPLAGLLTPVRPRDGEQHRPRRMQAVLQADVQRRRSRRALGGRRARRLGARVADRCRPVAAATSPRVTAGGVRLSQVRREVWSAGVGHAFSSTLPAPCSPSSPRAWRSRRPRGGRVARRGTSARGSARSDRDARRSGGRGRSRARGRLGTLVVGGAAGHGDGLRRCGVRGRARLSALRARAESTAGVRGADRGGT